MPTTVILSAVFAALFETAAFAAPPGDVPTLVRQLRSQYVVTGVGINGVVTRPGSVLVVQMDGIKALPAAGNYPCNTYGKGDRIKQARLCVINYSVSRDRQRPLQVGEKAYLTRIEVKGDEITFGLQSCVSCYPAQNDPNEAPYSASLTFQFAKGFLSTGSFKDVQDTVAQVFLIDTSTPATDAPPAPAAPAVQQAPDPATAPIAEPPAAPSPTPTLELGQTKDQVIAALGQPQRAAKVGNKEIYIYKDMKITFVDGKVTDVE